MSRHLALASSSVPPLALAPAPTLFIHARLTPRVNRPPRTSACPSHQGVEPPARRFSLPPGKPRTHHPRSPLVGPRPGALPASTPGSSTTSTLPALATSTTRLHHLPPGKQTPRAHHQTPTSFPLRSPSFLSYPGVNQETAAPHPPAGDHRLSRLNVPDPTTSPRPALAVLPPAPLPHPANFPTSQQAGKSKSRQVGKLANTPPPTRAGCLPPACARRLTPG